MAFIPVTAEVNYQHHYSSLQCHMIRVMLLWDLVLGVLNRVWPYMNTILLF